MNVLLVSQFYFPFVGGVETHARQVAYELSSRQHHVEIAALRFAHNQLPRRLRILGESLLLPNFNSYNDGPVPVHALSARGLFRRLRLLPTAMRATPFIQRFIYDWLNRNSYPFFRSVFLSQLRQVAGKADVIHSLAFGPLGWAARQVARERGIPFICTPFAHPGQWGCGPDDVAYYKTCDALIALVDSDKEHLVSLGLSPETIHVIGVSPDLPEACDGADFRSRHGLADLPVVVYVGRLMAQKGAPALLAAAPLVWQRHPTARFVFIGPGTDDEKAQFHNADPRISYLGKVSAQEKADALAACDVFCMPSMSEILPTVYLEAWSLGKPVIGGKAHGVPELVEDPQAGISSGQDPKELAGVLIRMLDDPQLRKRFGDNGRALVQAKYSTTAVTDSLEKLYQGLVDAGRTQPAFAS